VAAGTQEVALHESMDAEDFADEAVEHEDEIGEDAADSEALSADGTET